RIVDGQTVWYPTAATFDQITTARVAEGPYSNIGPLNNAAYRIGVKLGTDTMARIYLQTLREHLTAEAGPTELVVGTIRAAKQLFGGTSDELTAVRDAWKGVGLRAAAIDSIK
ncbi:MAG: M4 family metallopeptidase, partial [Thermoleophilia bacterium]|nr:M4 family metallopeptidase [Thermoleophilia bacterium]